MCSFFGQLMDEAMFDFLVANQPILEQYAAEDAMATYAALVDLVTFLKRLTLLGSWASPVE